MPRRSNDQIERDAKEHPEVVEERKAAELENVVQVIQPPDKAPPIGPDGQFLMFDGYQVELVESQIVGDLSVEADFIPEYATVRFEGMAKLLEVVHKDRKNTLVRFQKLYVLNVALVPNTVAPAPREEIEARMAARAAAPPETPADEVARKLAEAEAAKAEAQEWDAAEPDTQIMGDLQEQVVASARKVSERGGK